MHPIPSYADSGASTIVMDLSSGRVLYSKKIHEKKLIASITKIMTCIVVLENVSLEKKITVGEEVLSMYGTNLYLEVGEVFSVKDLLYGLMLRSGNDAAATLAVQTFGSEEAFLLKMNEKAKEIGMKDTTFQNPHGLDDQTYNYSTAYDMAILSRYAYQNEKYREIVSTKKYQAKSSTKSYLWYNRMSLLGIYSSCIGGKNGYTPKAGKTLVSLAKKGDLAFTIVSLDDPDIYSNHKNLYEKYFDQYENYRILDKDHFYIESSLIEDRDVYIKQDFYYPLCEEDFSHLSTLVHIYSKKKNQAIGEVDIQLRGESIGIIPIYEKTKKEKKFSFFSFFQKLFV